MEDINAQQKLIVRMEAPLNSPGKTPVKLESIDKKTIFTVPEGYFEVLPTLIEARVAPTRVARPQRPVSFLFGWVGRTVAFASVVLALLGAWWFNRQTTSATLAAVSNQEIITYLEESDMTHQELIETASNAGIPLDEALFQRLDISEDELKRVHDQDADLEGLI